MTGGPARAVLLVVVLLFAGCLGGNGDDGDGASSAWTAWSTDIDGNVAAVGLLDDDVHFDLYVDGQVLRGRGDGTFEPLAGTGAECADCAVQDVALGDLHEDNLTDVVVLTSDGVRVFRHEGDLAFAAADVGDALAGATGTAVTLVDVENDGDLDVVVGGSGVRVHENDGNATFAAPRPLASSGDVFAFVFADDDMLLDLVVATEAGLRILGNQEDAPGTFVDLGEDLPAPGDTKSIVVWDHDNDQLMDLLVAGSEGLRVYRNRGLGAYVDATADVGLPISGRADAAVAFDADNDRWEDVFAFVGSEPRLWLRRGDAYEEAPLPHTGEVGGRALIAADVDRDGRIDVLDTGRLRLMNGLDAGHHVTFNLRGNESNDAAVGVKSTISTGTFLMQRQSGGVGSSSVAVPNDPHFGLGDDVPDTLNVAILWPSGVLQFERPPTSRLLDQVVEARESMSEAPWEGC